MNKKNIPNFFCILRIILTPVIVFLLLYSARLADLFPFSLYRNTSFGQAMVDALDTANSFSIVIAGVIFVLAMITDYLDGHYARKYNVVSDKGKMLDPLADKILILGTLISFFLLDYQVQWPWEFAQWLKPLAMIFPVSIIVLREILVTVLRSIAAKKGVVVAAKMWGKVKTCSQTAALIIYFFAAFVHFPIYGQIMVWIAAIITLLSLFPYLKTFFSIFKKE
ncbi:MAG: CDP-diacylglycerol--glycerol-3-phosphate 3-phosphatidyltransferase [Ruminococcaceae bacterium]|nr:CDP-diacylglycerol--glycerol-3-phosphate 3-phosphatidyltransferase [Oscillospiraceae bacterium]